MKVCAVAMVLLAACAGEAAAACRGQDRFDTMMCSSHMCTDCVLDWCMETCQKIQSDFPDCRCASWPAARSTYSGGEFKGKGKYGDVGDYSK
mmetsp:Transcript_76219/g.227179  ORF Transcript_76219/g.227179 Transcript_76219/m.227179 type:complete len:92 (+) Transcript_76219:71-346(+)